jgi:hypothetical protein
MALLDPDAVDKLIDLLTLPVGGADDPRPESAADRIQGVSEVLGSVVFEDQNWYESYRPQDIQAVLEPWFDEATATELAARCADPDSPEAWQEFLAWCQLLVSNWKQGKLGVESSAQPGVAATLLGIANPHYELDRVPGTQFYKYVDGEYLYAVTADAAPEEWRTQEERYDDARTAAAVSPPSGMLMGYRNSTSVLPGTAFYRQLDGGEYVYAPTEVAEPDGWHGYEHWADLADEAAADVELLDEMNAFLTKLEQLLGD